MANKFQKLLFNISTISPLLVILTIIYWFEKDIIIFSRQAKTFDFDSTAIILISIAFLSTIFSFYSIFFIFLCQKKIERVSISVDNIVPNDSWVIAVLLSYAFPAAGIVFEEINNIYIHIGVVVFLFVFLTLSNTILPNPILMIQGYHFYKITTTDGSSDICLLSKRKSIHNRNVISTVIYAFSYLVIEEKNNDVY